jgi:hypothetical protein
MVVVFAVFLVAMLLAFLKPEGRPGRIARVSALLARAMQTASALLASGTEIVERAAAHVARDQHGRVGLDQLLHQPRPGQADPLDAKPEP